MSIAVIVAAIIAACLWQREAVDYLVYLWDARPEFSHGPLLPLLAVWLAWRKRGVLEELPRDGALAGVTVVALGVLVVFAGDLQRAHAHRALRARGDDLRPGDRLAGHERHPPHLVAVAAAVPRHSAAELHPEQPVGRNAADVLAARRRADPHVRRQRQPRWQRDRPRRTQARSGRSLRRTALPVPADHAVVRHGVFLSRAAVEARDRVRLEHPGFHPHEWPARRQHRVAGRKVRHRHGGRFLPRVPGLADVHVQRRHPADRDHPAVAHRRHVRELAQRVRARSAGSAEQCAAGDAPIRAARAGARQVPRRWW